MIEISLEKAQKWVQFLFITEDLNKWQKAYGIIKKSGFSLDKLGTSFEKIEESRIKILKSSAQKWLDLLQDPETSLNEFEIYLGFFKGEVEIGGFSFEDFGINIEDLKKLKKEKLNKSIERKIKEIFSGDLSWYEHKMALEGLTELLDKSEFSLVDFGTTMAKLEGMEPGLEQKRKGIQTTFP